MRRSSYQRLIQSKSRPCRPFKMESSFVREVAFICLTVTGGKDGATHTSIAVQSDSARRADMKANAKPLLSP